MARNYSPQFLGDPHVSVTPMHIYYSDNSPCIVTADIAPLFFHITATLTTLPSEDNDDEDDEAAIFSNASSGRSATFTRSFSLPLGALSSETVAEPLLATLSEVNVVDEALAASVANKILFCARTARLACQPMIKALHIEAGVEAFVDELPPDYDASSDDDDEEEEMLLEEDQVIRFVPASKESIEGLRKATTEKAATCTVCLEEVPAGSEATRLPCSHWYHMDCIVEWLEKNKLCPLCRFEMP